MRLYEPALVTDDEDVVIDDAVMVEDGADESDEALAEFTKREFLLPPSLSARDFHFIRRGTIDVFVKGKLFAKYFRIW